MRFRLWGVFVICYLSFVSSPASASFISLTTSLTASFEGDKLIARVEVINKGDESAYNVQAEMRFGGQTLLTEKQSEVQVNGTYSAEEKIPLSFSKPGTYPLVLIIHYTDANQYPFSALTGQLIVYRKQALPDLLGQLKSGRFAKKGGLRLSIKNIGDDEIRGKLQLVIPQELTAKNPPAEVSLPPRSEKTVKIELENFSALAGSSYQSFAIIEYEKADHHFAIVAPGIISIVEKNFFKDYQLLIYAAIIILLIIFFALQFKKK